MEVYGAAQPEVKEKFLVELVQACRKISLPLLVGGDFNIVRNPCVKNNDKFDAQWPFLFNAIVDAFDMREIEMSGHKFHGQISKRCQLSKKLDRVLASTEGEQKFL